MAARADVFALRKRLDAARLTRATAVAAVDDKQLVIERLRPWVAAGEPGGAPHGHSGVELLGQAEAASGELQETVRTATAKVAAIKRRIDAALDREPKLFGTKSNRPIALLPVRLETSFATARRLRVRVYPDDVHLDSHEVALTAEEIKLGRAYWAAAAKPAAAGATTRPADPADAAETAWAALLERLSPSRAVWVAHATRPGSPDPKLREDGVRRAPQTVVMPTRWRFLGLLDGAVVVDKTGLPVPRPLSLGLTKADEDAAPEGHGNWLIDFKAATAVGMAITLTLPEGVDHLDQLFVVGVQDATPKEAAVRLANTLRGHVFTSGLAFLAPGTPTNNTPDSRSDWSTVTTPRRPAARPPAFVEFSDAARLTTALGLPDAALPLAYSPGAARDTLSAAAAMGALTWPALTQAFVASASLQVDLGRGFANLDTGWGLDVRRHLVSGVRSRGVLPTLRIGRQPYGVLPVTALDEWLPEQGSTDEVVLPWIQRLRHHWRAALAPGWIPRVSDGRPADRTAVEVLTRLPTAHDLLVRRVQGWEETVRVFNGQAAWTPGPVMSVGGVAWDSELRWDAPTEVTSSLSWAGDDQPPDFSRVQERVAPDPARDLKVLDRTARKYADAVAILQRKLKADVYARRWHRSDGDGEPGPQPWTLFEAAASDGRDLALSLLSVEANWSSSPSFGGGEGGDDLAAALGIVQQVDLLVQFALHPEQTGGDKELYAQVRRAAEKALARAGDVQHWLDALAAVAPDDLGPLVVEATEVLSHRWDAWATSIPARRLQKIRKTAGTQEIAVGGYGWVENLHPAPAPIPVAGTTLVQSPDDGYVHAPSLHHAATAAVLRSGFLSHDGDTTMAVDLSSRRVRAAQWLLAGVRRGQELGPLLGYRFERALHDSHDDEVIGRFRTKFPRLTTPPTQGQEGDPTWDRAHLAIAARNVVDGLALAKDPGFAEAVAAGLQATDAQKADRVRRAYADLVDTLDAVGDLVLAESVHHLVGGNALRAGLAADTLGRGQDVPDRFEVTHTPRRGRAVTHRLVTMVPPGPEREDGWGRDAFTQLDPRLDAWVGHLLGPAGGWRLTGVVRVSGQEHPFDATAADLGFSALGTILLDERRRRRLDQRLRALAGAPAAGAATVEITRGWDRLLAVATAVRTLLATTTPLRPLDVAATGHDATADWPELVARVKAFAQGLSDADAQRLGLDGPIEPLAALAAKAPSQAWLAAVGKAVEELVGVALPIAPVLSGTGMPGPRTDVDGPAVLDFLRLQGSVRPSVLAWHDLLAWADARHGAATPLTVSQDPPGGAWIAGTFDELERPPARCHWVRHAPCGSASASYAGFVVDQWADLLPGSDALGATKVKSPQDKQPAPAQSELSGVAFHFDRPDARAPQAILVAVPPDLQRGWTADTLALAVRDTLELAKLRAVDLGDLPLLENLLPITRFESLSGAGAEVFGFWNELVGEGP